MNSETTTRLKKVINWLIFQGIAENERELAEKLGYTKSSFSQLVNGKVPLTDKFLRNLCAMDENINDVWIRTGDGDLFKSDPMINQMVYGDHNQVAGRDINVSSSDVGKLIDTVNAQQATIAELVRKLTAE
jgi:transcriptional regulator with XRE-family HTH domain